ncbi:MAG: hypothetical protein ACTS6A_02785 [Candidatus Hodgkinia cicadicola]
MLSLATQTCKRSAIGSKVTPARLTHNADRRYPRRSELRSSKLTRTKLVGNKFQRMGNGVEFV